MKKITLFLFFILSAHIIKAEDKINRINPTDKILSKGTTPDISDSTFNKEFKNVSALKLSLLTPIFGVTILSYEQSLKAGLSLEVGAGMIGLGNDLLNDNPKGVILRTGFKFRRTPSYFKQHNYTPHILKGYYFGPELVYSHYSNKPYIWENTTYYNGPEVISDSYRNTHSAISLMVTGGHQWVINNSLLIDVFGGIGYTYNDFQHNNNNTCERKINYYGFSLIQDDFPLSISLGVKFGFILNPQKSLNKRKNVIQ